MLKFRCSPALVTLLLFVIPTGGNMTDNPFILPDSVAGWVRADGPRRVTAETIFDYMDGAGELYVGYRFDRLEVSEYRAEGRPDILVEIYAMKTPDDAFGLLSLDWGGENVALEPGESKEAGPAALYGEGLLRLRSGSIYARILAERETPSARMAVLVLGRAASRAGEGPSPPPGLFQNLPESPAAGWSLLRGRKAFFRTHLVLNSLYYLGPENMLELDHDVEGVSAVFQHSPESGEKQRIHCLRINYAGVDRTTAALRSFHEVYLPEAAPPAPPGRDGRIRGIFPLEDGWLGYELAGRILTLVFEGPDRKTVRAFLQGLS